ncbi:OmpL47-type beta-barrel domain-containing protein [Alkaliphilus peptidifermentans]|uniref:S-layer homology domain-containing protein n=1 Tax=Alkaliphilus peptidifermentans DSM 18978 TaxID=1120976 RepID=A0A1G5DSX0_9FIRM|nr:S-layer homology domain-containing protein [Alkaliphilus peptidifermentans]SCY17764.1 S-layer homology domain-containing protein [Alkaliphilus peptidifermentans DSM 18978]
MKTKKFISISILLTMLFTVLLSYVAIQEVEGSTVLRLKDLPKGAIVYDDAWTIKFYSDLGSTVRKTGVVDWRVADKNYYGKNEVTLMSNEYWNIGGMLGSWSNRADTRMRDQFNAAEGDKELFQNNIISVRGDVRTNAGSWHITYDIVQLPDLYLLSLTEHSSWRVFPSVSNGSMLTRINGNWSSGYGPTSWFTVSSAWSDAHDSDSASGMAVPFTNLHGNTGVQLQPNGKYKLLLNEIPEVNITTPEDRSNTDGNHISIAGTVKDKNTYDTLKLYYTVSTLQFGQKNYLNPIADYTDIHFQNISANGTEQSFGGLIPNNPVFPRGPLAVSVYAEDDVGGRSEVETIFIANNNSTRYYYDKFNVNPGSTTWQNTYEFSVTAPFSGAGLPTHVDGVPVELYSAVTHNKLTGIWEGAGTKLTSLPPLGTPIYTNIERNGEIISVRLIQARSWDSEDGYWIYYWNRATIPSGNIKGTLNTSNVIAREYSLPNDGIHWDGFWYVKKSIANMIPTITINNPTTTKYYKAGENISLSGTVEDEDNDTVTVSATLNGVQKSVNITNTSTSKEWTLTWLSNEIAQGTYNNVVVNADDGKGGTSTASHTASIIVDKTAPNAPNIMTNENWTNAASVPVTITHGTDTGGSGVNRTEYSLSGATTLGWTTYTAAFNITNAGQTTIIARTIDNASNISSVSTKAVKIDRIPTTGVIGGNVSDWTNDNVILTLTATDSGGSGVRRISRPDSTWVDGNSAIYTVTGNGTYSFTIEDNAGNQTTVIEVVDKIDKTSPVVDADNKDYSWKKTDIVFQLTYHDEGGSGLNAGQYQVTNTEGEPLDGWLDYDIPIIISSDGIYYLHYRATDNAGNITKGYFGPYRRDTLDPAITATLSTEEHTNEDVDILLEFHSNGSLIVSKKWGTGTLSIEEIRDEGTDIDESNTITVSENGYYTIYTIDEAGNEVVEVIEVNNIDKIPPVVTADNEDSQWQNQDITVNLEYTDEGVSGLDLKLFKLTTNTDIPEEDEWEPYNEEKTIDESGEYYIHYKAKDYAGNEKIGFFSPYRLDKEIPTAPEIIREPDIDHNRDEYQITITPGEDTVSGIKDIFYKLTGATEIDWTLYEEIIEIENQGETTIYAKNTDNAGNESEITSITVLIYGEAYEMAVEALDKGEGLVDIAKDSQSQTDVDTAKKALDEARDLIDLLPDTEDKTHLLERLSELEGELDIVQTIINIRESLKEIQETLENANENPTQDIVDAIQDLINETQDLIDTLPEGEEKDNLQNQLDEYKDQLNDIQEMVDIINTLNMKLDNADLDFTVNPTSLVLDALDSNQYYSIIIRDMETDTIIIDTTATASIEVPNTKQGHLYSVELKAYHQDELIAIRTFEKLKPDLIPPTIEYVYILNGTLNLKATDNYKLHETPYGFRIVNLGENETTVLSVEENEFGTMILVAEYGDNIKNTNFSTDNFIKVQVPKTVTITVIDSYLNETILTLDVTKNNEALYGDVPQDVIDKIHEANRPPREENIGSSTNNPNTNQNPKPKPNENNSGVNVDPNLPSEVQESIKDALGEKNIRVEAPATEINSGKGKLEINAQHYIDGLKNVLQQHDYNELIYFRIDVIEKDTNSLVYTNILEDIDKIIIPDLADSTSYIVRISLIHNNVRLAFREIEKQTHDATPPVIEKVIINGGTMQVFATDNIRLHDSAYQFQVQYAGTTAFVNPYEVKVLDRYFVAAFDLGSIRNLASNWTTDAWTTESRLGGLDTGSKVRIIVRDHAENYTLSEIEVQEDGVFYDTVNGDSPLNLKPNQQVSLQDILNDLIDKINKSNPDGLPDSFNIDDYEVRLSDPSIAYIENGNLITKGSGKLVVTFRNKLTGAIYKYSIVISDAASFDRRIIIQTSSETNLVRAFEHVIRRDFSNSEIEFLNINEELGTINDGYIFKANDEEGLATLTLTDGIKEVPLYVIIVNENFPQSDIELIKTNLSYIVKMDQTIDIKEISVFYNELFDEANSQYLVVEGTDDKVEVLDAQNIYTAKEGITVVRVIDLVKQKIEEIDFKIVDMNSKEDGVKNVGHWAEDSINSIVDKGIANGYVDETFNPDEAVTILEFLTMYSRTKTYMKDDVNQRRNVIPIELDKDDNYYYILESLNNITIFEIEHIFGKNIDFNRFITREEVAAFIVLENRFNGNADETKLKDITKSIYTNEINLMYAKGIMKGHNDVFRPHDSLTQAELFTVLERIISNLK